MLRKPDSDLETASNLELVERSSIWDDLGITGFTAKARRHLALLWLIPVLWIAFSNIWFFVQREEYQGKLQIVSASLFGTGAMSHGSGLSGILGGTGLDGILGGTQSNDTLLNVYTESWTAPWFAAEILKNQNLTQRIFARRWSTESKSWKPRHVGLGSVVTGIFGVSRTRPVEPDVQDVVDFLERTVKIDSARNQAITLVEFQSDDRDLIADLLNFGHAQITLHLRQMFQRHTEEDINYLIGKLSQVTVADYRNALILELGQQQKLEMMAFANEQFIAQPLGVYVTTDPISPQPALVILVSLLLSLICYAACVGLAARRESVPAEDGTISSRITQIYRGWSLRIR